MERIQYVDILFQQNCLITEHGSYYPTLGGSGVGSGGGFSCVSSPKHVSIQEFVARANKTHYSQTYPQDKYLVTSRGWT